ncbi:MAG: class I mannose-6-phosphate isomerase [Chthoniobacterales bacterium]|nr:class I mannose-6-phosphate isomerase [Chthoniobacterales bacterium]
MSLPLIFQPIFQVRVWGGRSLETLFQKPLPPDLPIGESWEICDRPEAQSIVTSENFKGKTLNDLWSNHRVEVFGEIYRDYPAGRFPLLVKLLDAREKLSVQVHPPPEKAKELSGEPKTEVWIFLDCSKDACIYAGLQRGITKEKFLNLLEEGKLEEALQRIPVSVGKSIFIPSGRVHAIGAGNVIAEIQQNSDTTYRVYDWNRVGLDGKPRELHISQSLASINFNDFTPNLQDSNVRVIADCPYFRVERKRPPFSLPEFLSKQFAIWLVVSGKICIGANHYKAGTFVLLPPKLDLPISFELTSDSQPELLEITLPAKAAE